MPQHPATPSTALPAFVARHIGPGEADVARMLAVVGQPSLDALVDAALPHLIRSEAPLALAAAASEAAVIASCIALPSIARHCASASVCTLFATATWVCRSGSPARL